MKNDGQLDFLRLLNDSDNTNIDRIQLRLPNAHHQIHDEDAFNIIPKLEIKLKCIIGAIGDAVKDTNWFSKWNETKNELKWVLYRMKACRTEQNLWESLKQVIVHY